MARARRSKLAPVDAGESTPLVKSMPDVCPLCGVDADEGVSAEEMLTHLQSHRYRQEGSTMDMYRCLACQWAGFEDKAVVVEVDEDGITEYACPGCGGECVPMDDKEVQEWERWQWQVSEAYGVLLKEWRDQPKPRQGKRPTRDEAERRLHWHITH